jgi:O-antigen/teichoic acid export membrane protein
VSHRRALIWSFAERYASFVVTVASTLVLSRLLTPKQVGVYSLCASLGTIATILRDFGVSEYLIQERELTQAKIRTAFGVALGVAWTLGAAVFLGRHALAGYFGEPGVAEVLAITALQFFILPLSSPAFALMNRELAFRQIFILQSLCNIAQAATSLTLAWQGFGTLSLAWGPMAGVATQTLLLCWMRPRESLVLPGLSEWRSVLRFGSVYMGARLIETLAQNIHEPFIAKRFDFASVGLFSRAFGMVEMFRSNVADAIVRVATPAFAAEHRAGRPLAEAFGRATAIFVSLSWPFFGFVALCAPEIVEVMFGPQWAAAAPLASWLALAAIPGGLVELVPQMLSATGHVGKRLRVALWVSPVHVAAVFAASFAGLGWMALAFGVSHIVALGLWMSQLRVALGVDLMRLYRPCVASAALAAGSIAVQAGIAYAARAQSLPAWLVVGLALAGGGLAWAALGRAMAHPAYGELAALVGSLRSGVGNVRRLP